MTDKPVVGAPKEPTKEEIAAQEAARKEEAKKNSVVYQETNRYEKPIMGKMSQNFAQMAFTTKDGKDLQLYP